MTTFKFLHNSGHLLSTYDFIFVCRFLLFFCIVFVKDYFVMEYFTLETDSLRFANHLYRILVTSHE